MFFCSREGNSHDCIVVLMLIVFIERARKNAEALVFLPFDIVYPFTALLIKLHSQWFLGSRSHESGRQSKRSMKCELNITQHHDCSREWMQLESPLPWKRASLQSKQIKENASRFERQSFLVWRIQKSVFWRVSSNTKPSWKRITKKTLAKNRIWWTLVRALNGSIKKPHAW